MQQFKFFCQWRMLSMAFDRTPKSKLATLDTFFLVRQDHSQMSSLSLAQRWLANVLYFFLSREAKCSLASLALNATGGNNAILVWTRQHQIDGLHVDRSAAFSCETHLASCELKENYETRKTNYFMFIFIFLICQFYGEAWLSLASVNTCHW